MAEEVVSHDAVVADEDAAASMGDDRNDMDDHAEAASEGPASGSAVDTVDQAASAQDVEPAEQQARTDEEKWQTALAMLSVDTDTDLDGLIAAESGRLGVPALVFFHADWCHVCQEIRPDVAVLESNYDGRAAVIQMNVDSADSQDAKARYGVRGTPTFVVLNGNGEMLDRMSGWPGEDRLVAAIESGLQAN